MYSPLKNVQLPEFLRVFIVLCYCDINLDEFHHLSPTQIHTCQQSYSLPILLTMKQKLMDFLFCGFFSEYFI